MYTSFLVIHYTNKKKGIFQGHNSSPESDDSPPSLFSNSSTRKSSMETVQTIKGSNQEGGWKVVKKRGTSENIESFKSDNNKKKGSGVEEINLSLKSKMNQESSNLKKGSS